MFLAITLRSQRAILGCIHTSLEAHVAGLNGETDWIHVATNCFEHVGKLTNLTDTLPHWRVTFLKMEGYSPAAADQPTNCTNDDIVHPRWCRLFVTPLSLEMLFRCLLGGDEKAQQCGWLKDRYGLSWQIVPAILIKLFQDKDPEKSKRVMQAMLQMKRIQHFVRLLVSPYFDKFSSRRVFTIVSIKPIPNGHRTTEIPDWEV